MARSCDLFGDMSDMSISLAMRFSEALTFEAVFWSAAAPLRRVSTRAESTVRALIRAPNLDSHHDHALGAAVFDPALHGDA
jgi:hypothetical protein